MAQIIGAVATSHVPSIGNIIEKGLQKDPYWKPFFDAFDPVHEWLGKKKPDAAVVIYNDHGLIFFSTRCRPSLSAPPSNTRMPIKDGA